MNEIKMKTIYKYSFMPRGAKESEKELIESGTKPIEVEFGIKDGKFFKKWGEKWHQEDFILPEQFRGIIWLVLKLEDCPAEFADFGYLGHNGSPRINHSKPLQMKQYKRGLKILGIDHKAAEAIQKY